MTFLSPLFLLGLATLAVPILLHLLRRRETRSLDFPALRYLTRTTREQARIIRLRQLLLLALRLAALALVVLAAAQWVLPVGGSDHPPAGLALVIDNGLVSGAVTEDARVLDHLVERAREALERTGERDLVWIVAAGEPWAPAFPLSPDEARGVLDRLAPTHVTADLPAALERAAALLEAGAPPLREILLLSGLHESSFPPIPATAAPRAVRVRILQPRISLPPNQGVEEIVVAGGLSPRAGEGGDLQVRLGGEELAGSPVRGYMGEDLISAVRAGPDGIAVLPFPPVDEGWVTGRVEVDPDGLRADDVAHFAFRAIPPPVVETVGELPSFLDDALDVLEAAGRIRRGSEAGVDLRFVGAGAPSLPAPTHALVLIPPSDPAGLPSLNVLLEAIVPGWRIDAIAPTAGQSREITGGSGRDLFPTLPPVREAHRIAEDGSRPTAPGTNLLTLSDGEPWLVRIESPSVAVLVLASPLTLAASEIPASAAMVPLVDFLTTGALVEAAASGSPAGRPLVLPLGTASVRVPDGTVRPHFGPHLTETGIGGLYQFLNAEGNTLGYAAVHTGSPGSSAPIGAEEARRRLESSWPEAVAADSWPEGILEGRRGREVWRPLLAALFLVLVAEGWLAGWGGAVRGTSAGAAAGRGGRRSDEERGGRI